ncbi:hypothetical protein STRCI_001183 [Streptomyces cinnabarinus]|uniref:Uncharacterized protein n=1 Tax=Streptomyces cinnabarinus TaxID=67287 RepID=A0ABY7K971_9ACTN|nr:hypothetical protein [Streptomyces cinnabarinus]WAZ20088.1 hypothetical protein STRCI_001183 [Streptomyces cinnabarinus]
MENVAAQWIEYTDREREERGDPPLTAFEELQAAAKIVTHGTRIMHHPVYGVARLADGIRRNSS